MQTDYLTCIPSEQLGKIRKQMLQFARLQLNDQSLAEDMVQEALSSAYQYADKFLGEASLKTWIFAILKNKIIDNLRQRQKWVTESDLEYDNIHLAEQIFKQGKWDDNAFQPSEWQGVEQSLYRKEFWIIFEYCLNQLPAIQARVFMMRHHLELDSQMICQECDISASNLHTLLYRARLQLQVCLSQKWFGE
ncbi:sigma-70 family RNA polymerase sigma factor [Glaesserella parasuis]|nr:sigma-70 family RNA polymerase sigma factor [Glaesserella parasuis]MDP0093716.1 sigma-70 family RNA polymerase sigma factor [Glaesserella parasuis]